MKDLLSIWQTSDEKPHFPEKLLKFWGEGICYDIVETSPARKKKFTDQLGNIIIRDTETQQEFQQLRALKKRPSPTRNHASELDLLIISPAEFQ